MAETKDGTNRDEKVTYKTTYLTSSVDPDLTIVVGGHEFKEYSTILRYWSDYFDAGLRSGMQESESMKFEFPNEDPAEWEWIMALTAPLPSVAVTNANVLTALMWFDRLGSSRGLSICDRVVRSEMVAVLLPEEETSQNWLDLKPETIVEMRTSLEKLLDALQTGIRYDLDETKAACFETITRCLACTPALFEMDQLTTLASFLRDDEGSRVALWSSLREHLPPPISDQQDTDLLQCLLLPALVHTEILRKVTEQRMDRESQKAQEKLNEAKGQLSAESQKAQEKLNEAKGQLSAEIQKKQEKVNEATRQLGAMYRAVTTYSSYHHCPTIRDGKNEMMYCRCSCAKDRIDKDSVCAPHLWRGHY